jgi:predicted metal-dependent phosphoesterase TrpH
MNIDLHTHVKISKKTRFNHDYFRQMIREAGANGLHALAVTEHFNTLLFHEIYETLDREYEYHDDCYEFEGMRLFPGMEIDVEETGHILVIGGRRDIIAIRRELDAHTEPGAFFSMRRLLDLKDQYDVLTIGAHPFRTGTPLHHLDWEMLSRLDALDLNGKDLHAQGSVEYRSKLRAFAEELGLPVVGGSDTHHYLQYGCVWNEFEEDCRTVRQLKDAINRGSYEVHVSPCLDTKVKSASIVKEMLKKEAAPAS